MLEEELNYWLFLGIMISPLKEYDGLFISNGPGDPAVMDKTVERLQKSLKKVKPQFSVFV